MSLVRLLAAPTLGALVLCPGCRGHKGDRALIGEGLAAYNAGSPAERAREWKDVLHGASPVHDCTAALTADRGGIKIDVRLGYGPGSEEMGITFPRPGHHLKPLGTPIPFGGSPTTGRFYRCRLGRTTVAGRRTVDVWLTEGRRGGGA